jgi:hypothetical protein
MDIESKPQAEHDPRFASEAEGTKAVAAYRDSWTRTLGSRSVEACYAIIGAAWAIHGGSGILRNAWATFAVVLALFHLGAGLGVVLWIVVLLDRRLDLSQREPETWKLAWQTSARPDSHWPYTALVDRVGLFFQWEKAIVPMFGALSLVVSFFCR